MNPSALCFDHAQSSRLRRLKWELHSMRSPGKHFPKNGRTFQVDQCPTMLFVFFPPSSPQPASREWWSRELAWRSRWFLMWWSWVWVFLRLCVSNPRVCLGYWTKQAVDELRLKLEEICVYEAHQKWVNLVCRETMHMRDISAFLAAAGNFNYAAFHIQRSGLTIGA